MKISDLVTLSSFIKSVVPALIAIGIIIVLNNSNWNIKTALLNLINIGKDHVKNEKTLA